MSGCGAELSKALGVVPLLNSPASVVVLGFGGVHLSLERGWAKRSS